ncbi:class II glutamine amidotransferase [Streptomyces showdoensis]|uniref:Glutamine amidotransferase n=1 Tax=Streptomyces showdoensis TaxID=68268 RepID=A0A2P2GHK3_STREW|nr:class II glutamine amidotransferase [Streptomyces showdoensis]KKZ71000.1 glutamine amidotransferase [Streptomyces showdoensis]
MCRWLVYAGTPVLLDTILYKPAHSLIEQSRNAKLGVETTNGDGFGIGWYTDESDTPALLRDVGPAWNNRNLRELADHVRSPLFFAHIRASTGTAVQQSNCHPFRRGRWMFMHNGAIAGFRLLRRDLSLRIDPALYADLEGTTDSEVMFYLAVTLGLEQDPPAAVARMAGVVEDVGRRHGVDFPLQMTVALTDGHRVWAFRYSSERASRSLFYSSRVDDLRKLHPDVAFLRNIAPQTRLIVSEPLDDLPGAWNEMPESSYRVIAGNDDVLHPFAPVPADDG